MLKVGFPEPSVIWLILRKESDGNALLLFRYGRLVKSRVVTKDSRGPLHLQILK